jgi:GxxExxY protein
MLYQETTDRIIKAFYDVYNTLGYGFLEKVYENSMYIELSELGLKCKKQVPINVYFKNERVGEYFGDIIVDDKIIIELKAAETIVVEHELQLVNYLKATGIEVGLLLNFGKKPQFKRKIYTQKNNQRGSAESA